jgi:outer membrane receptor protein involved in Fe transport
LSYGTCPTDLSGQKPAGIPEFSVAVGTTYTHEFSDSLRAIAHVDFNHESPVTIAQGLPTWRRQVDNLNGSLTFALTNIGKGLELTLWGRNITNQQTITTVFPSVAQSGSLSGYPSQPRTWGGLVRYRF